MVFHMQNLEDSRKREVLNNMLKNAKLYENEVNEKARNTWYNLRYQYVNGWCGCSDFSFPENNYESHHLVSVDPDTDEVIGIIGYGVDWASRCANGFHAMSFVEGGSFIFARDLFQMIDDIFMKYNLNRMEWGCWADNHALKGYRKFCKRFGGREAGFFRQKGILMDGKLHDSYIFELLREDYIKAVESRRGK